VCEGGRVCESVKKGLCLRVCMGASVCVSV
jgi:hypothetical protein